MATALFLLLPLFTLAVPTMALAATKNANMDGKWTASDPTDPTEHLMLVISNENITTGDFTGVFPFHFTDASGVTTITNLPITGKVTGNTFTLTVDLVPKTVVGTYGAQWVAHGTTNGDAATVSGVTTAWENGKVHTFSGSGTMSRASSSDTSTDVTCKEQDAPVGTFSCTATVTATDADSDAPSGTVKFSVPKGTFKDASCDLKADSDDSSSASCSSVYTPTAAANEANETVTATYTSDGDLGTSNGSATIDAVAIAAADKTVDTYEEGSDNATFTISLSRVSNVAVNVDYATKDGTGDDAASAADGDYTKTDGTLSFAPGETSKKVEVPCFPNIDLRDPSDFDLVLTNPDGAEFPTTATTTALDGGPEVSVALVDDASTTLLGDSTKKLVVQETIDPDLVAGKILKITWTGNLKTEPQITVKRFKTGAVEPLVVGSVVYVGDEISVGKTTLAAMTFTLGGRVGIDAGTTVKVVSERSTALVNGTLYDVIRHKIAVGVKVLKQTTPLLIQTNGGVMGIKG